MPLLHIWTTVLGAAIGLTNANPLPSHSSLPIVDLGYVRQQASAYSSTGKYFNFTNIAFAQPPTGDLRFAAPRPPKRISGVQNGGSIVRTCPQGEPQWLSQGQEIPLETEDCLYLDVLVPEKIFQQRSGSAAATGGAPVLVWIYGGGNVLGGKTTNGGGDGLVARGTQATDSDGVIFVAMNYRVGLFGFLGGNEFVAQGGAPNAGLLDQRLALEWVQKYIHLFGGDPCQVTVMGESGGASSIGHHLIASGSKGAPFKQAIFQSPDESPELLSNDVLNSQLGNLFKALNVSTLAEARRVDTYTIQKYNQEAIRDVPQGRFAFAYSNDGSYVRETVNQGLVAGRFDPKVKIMTSYNADEGLIFTPAIDASYNFSRYVASYVPHAPSATIAYITDELYPASAFPEPTARAQAFIADATIHCLAYGLERAYHDQGYAYEFAIPPGFHTQDLPYTFYNGSLPSPPDSSFNATIALDMQSYFVNFAVHARPNAASAAALPALPIYGAQGKLLSLTSDGYEVVKDAHKGKACEFWANYKP